MLRAWSRPGEKDPLLQFFGILMGELPPCTQNVCEGLWTGSPKVNDLPWCGESWVQGDASQILTRFGIMENQMDTTIMGYIGILGYILGFRRPLINKPPPLIGIIIRVKALKRKAFTNDGSTLNPKP